MAFSKEDLLDNLEKNKSDHSIDISIDLNSEKRVKELEQQIKQLKNENHQLQQDKVIPVVSISLNTVVRIGSKSI